MIIHTDNLSWRKKKTKQPKSQSVHDRPKVIKLLRSISEDPMFNFYQTHYIFYFNSFIIIYLFLWERDLPGSRNFSLVCSLLLPQPSKCASHQYLLSERIASTQCTFYFPITRSRRALQSEIGTSNNHLHANNFLINYFFIG